LAILRIIEETMVDGPGIRTAIYAAGCTHRCQGCHNPQSWDIRAGQRMSMEEILSPILGDPFADVTFTGGDPMMQPEGFTELARAIKKRSGKTIWCYTGYLFEEVIRMPAQAEMLKYIDVLVDGPFVQDLRDEQLRFRGSSNQRLVDVQRSLKEKKTILWE
ncbi:MAG: anaerobic ribonucleoside-triphosphate reductase activating protein, partial [Bacteroidaceae bacterium]|nr:anaerobic ribonucleoside-triphosphate reductase activating protein [Bacteroidaceae bacterium]